MRRRSLGMIETWGYAAAIEAADVGLKTANVELLGYEITKTALITIKFAGDVMAVKTAVDAGKIAADRVGRVFATHVIPRPDKQLIISPLTSSDPLHPEKKGISEVKSELKNEIKEKIEKAEPTQKSQTVINKEIDKKENLVKKAEQIKKEEPPKKHVVSEAEVNANLKEYIEKSEVVEKSEILEISESEDLEVSVEKPEKLNKIIEQSVIDKTDLIQKTQSKKVDKEELSLSETLPKKVKTTPEKTKQTKKQLSIKKTIVKTKSRKKKAKS